jgi:hypothetical protein
VFAAQWLETANVVSRTPTTGAPLQAYQYQALPSTQGELFQKVGTCTEWAAKKGTYMPFRYSQSNHLYQPTTQVEGQKTWLGMGTGQEALSTPWPGVLVGTNNVTPPTYSPVALTKDMNVHFGAMFYTGLSQATTLQLKVRQGLEAIPTPTGPWAAFIETNPLPRPDVLLKVAQVQSQMALCYEEHYNSLGALLPAIAPLAVHGIQWAIGKLFPGKKTARKDFEDDRHNYSS